MKTIHSPSFQVLDNQLPRAEALRSAIDMSHYTLVSSLAGECRSSNESFVLEVLGALTAQNPMRAALVLTDVSTQIMDLHGSSTDRAALERLESSLSRSQLKDVLFEHLERLPTFDAIKCRLRVANMNGHRVLGTSLGAIAHITNEPDLPRYLSAMRKSFSGDEASPRNLTRFITTVAESFHPLRDTPRLSEENQKILDEYQQTIVRALFPLERYGYGHVCDALQRANSDTQIACVQGLWGASLDEPSPSFHQCADSAPATRSFFVSRGIPADVYVVSVGGTAHNITIVFFSEDGKFIPVVADASPYGGFYSVETNEQFPHTKFVNPLGITHLYSQRATPLSIMSGDFRYQGMAGLLPWFCEELPSQQGRIIGFAGVSAWQKTSTAERGTPEFYGNGERTRHLAMDISVLPNPESDLPRSSSSPFIQANITLKGGNYVLETSGTELPPTLSAEIMSIALKHFPDVERTIRRLEIAIDD